MYVLYITTQDAAGKWSTGASKCTHGWCGLHTSSAVGMNGLSNSMCIGCEAWQVGVIKDEHDHHNRCLELSLTEPVLGREGQSIKNTYIYVSAIR